MAPPRTHATSITTRLPPGLMSGLDKWIADQPEPRPLRVEAIRRLLERGLAPAPAPSEDTAELRRQLIRLAGKVDGFVAYTRQVEAERDALAAWAPRLEVVSRPGEQFGARQSPRAVPPVERWPADPRSDPVAVARARAQLAAAETKAEERRREGLEAAPGLDAAPRD